MLGDGGANALGAVVGSQIAFGTPRAVRWAALAGVVGLMLASERVSFSKVIAGNPWLNKADMFGRRPAPDTTGGPGSANGVRSTAAADPVGSPGA